MWRELIAWAAVVSIVVAVPHLSRAAEPEADADALCTRDARAASHVGELSGEMLTWRSRYSVPPAADTHASRLEFTRPLPAEAELVETSPPAARLVRGISGRPTALRLPASATTTREVSLVLRQPFQPGRGLRPPFSGERTLQRVVLEGVRFEPDEASSLQKFPGYIAPRKYGSDARSRIEAYLGSPSAKLEQTLYARPVDIEASRLRGELTSSAAFKTRLVLILFGVLVVLGVVGGLGYKLLESRAEEERADAILEEYGASSDEPWGDEFEGLGEA